MACSSARMLRPSRPMMRPFRSSLGRSTTETVVSIVCSAALRWMASVMYWRALAAACSRASASSRFTRLAASRRASASMCLSSRSLASSVVRPDRRSSSCCWCGDQLLVFRGGRRRASSRVSATACGLRLQILVLAFGGRGLVGNDGLAAAQLLLGVASAAAPSRGPRVRPRVRSSCAFSLASSSASFLRVSASRSASLRMRSACSSARPMVSAAMRLRLATQ